MYEDDFTRAMSAVMTARAAATAASAARTALATAEREHANAVAALRALGWDDSELTDFAVPHELPKPKTLRKPKPKTVPKPKLAAVA